MGERTKRRGATRGSAVLFAATALSGLPLAGLRADEAKWGSLMDMGIRAGETRRIGEADMFLPIAQDGRSLLFLDLRTTFDNLNQREGNFGLGYRAMQDSGWNLGAYAFFDRRRSSEAHYFSQVTAGLEALGQDFDARANAYLPVGRKSYDVEDSTRVDLSGGSIQIQSGIERAYHGGDAELGWRVPVFDSDQDAELRLYGGGYWFDAEKSDSVAGPRGRLELRLYDPVEALPGSRVTFSGEIQHDDARGTQHFLGLKLRIPLQAETSASRLSPQERRMTDPLIRDVDIVTQSATVAEAATIGGQTVSSLTTITDGTTAQSIIDGAAGNTLIVLNGTATVTSQVTLKQGQTLSSGGGTMTLTGATSGRTASFTVPGSAGTLRGAIAGDAVLALTPGSGISGLTVENTSTANNSHAVSAVGANGASIATSRLVAAKGTALWIDNSDSMTVASNTITAADGIGISLRDSDSAVLTGNTVGVTASGMSALSVSNGSGGRFSGNILTATGLTGSALSMSGGNGYALSGNHMSSSGMSGNAVSLLNSTGLTLDDNVISASGAKAAALRMDQSSGTVSGNTISTTGNGDGTTNPHALWITHGDGSTIAGNTISASGQYSSALYVDNSAATVITGNNANAGGYAGRALQLFNSAGSTVTGNTLVTTDTNTLISVDTTATALFMGNSAGTTISGNTITTRGYSAAGMNLRYSANLTVADNTITTIAEQATAMVLTGSNDSAVTGNRISTAGSSANGIQLFLNANNTRVEGNTVAASGAGAMHVYIHMVDGVSVVNNQLVGVGNGGVSAASATNLTVSGNTP